MKNPKAKRPSVTKSMNEPATLSALPSGAMAIHLIEKRGLIRLLDLATDEYESGFWSLGSEKAQSLVGGDVYFHRARANPSFFGGRVLGYRIQAEGEFAGRVVLRLRSEMGHQGVKTGSTGWSLEKKIVTAASVAEPT